MAARAGDFRLDAALRKECAEDVEISCSFEKKTLETVLNNDARVIECLQDYREELINPECAKAVHATMTRASEDIRFAASLAEACYEDRQKYCGNVKAVRTPYAPPLLTV
jgi:Golgi apparatus protein 1